MLSSKNVRLETLTAGVESFVDRPRFGQAIPFLITECYECVQLCRWTTVQRYKIFRQYDLDGEQEPRLDILLRDRWSMLIQNRHHLVSVDTGIHLVEQISRGFYII